MIKTQPIITDFDQRTKGTKNVQKASSDTTFSEYDEDNPPIDPITTPELYNAMMQAVAERNRRIANFQSR